MFFVVQKTYSINTVLQLVFSHPLWVLWILPSLCGDTCYCGEWIAQVNLQPLVVIFGAGFPGSRAIQSAHVDPKFAGMPLGRDADLSVRDNAALHAKSLPTICMSKRILIKYYTTKQKG